MLVTRRLHRAPQLAAQIDHHWALHSRYRALYSRMRNVGWDDALGLSVEAPRVDRVDRPMLLVVLEGRCLARAPGVECWVTPGEALVVDRKGQLSLRSERAAHEMIALEWEPGDLAGAVRAGAASWRLGAAARAAAVAYARVFSSPDACAPAVAPALASLRSALRAEGVPLCAVEPRALVEAVDPAVGRTTRVLDALLGSLSARPTIADVGSALGVGERQALRLVERSIARYAFNSRSWRDAAARWRTRIGAALMSARGATTEGVASLVGFGSPSAFCHAMDQAGLPTPGDVARAWPRS